MIQLTYCETMVYVPGIPAAPHPWGNDTIPTKKCAFVAFRQSNELPRSSKQGDRPPVNGPVQKWVLVTLLSVLINGAHWACVRTAILASCSAPRFWPRKDSSVPAQPMRLCIPIGATLPCAGKLIGRTQSVKNSCETNWIWKYFSN